MINIYTGRHKKSNILQREKTNAGLGLSGLFCLQYYYYFNSLLDILFIYNLTRFFLQMNKYHQLEDKIRVTGTEIFSLIKGEVPSVFDKKKWVGGLMEWAIKDDNFKVQLLRFIDVLPSLTSNALIVRVLKEYFADEEITPLAMKWGIKSLSEKGLLPKITGRVIRLNVEALARQFIAGQEPEDAIRALHDLRDRGFTFTVDLLGEVVVSDRESRNYCERYLSLLEFLQSEFSDSAAHPTNAAERSDYIPGWNISLKISSLYSQLDPIDWEGSVEKAIEGLRPIFMRAQAVNASITLDMEHFYIKDLTIAIFKRIVEKFRDFPYAGLAVQTYLKETKKDVIDLIEWARMIGTPIGIRLVKGAYWDYETVVNTEKGWDVPVFMNKEETDRSFEELTNILLENTKYVRPAIASHNIRSISNAIAVADSLSLPKNSYEFQVLYGMAEPVRDALQKMGHRVCIYTAVGELIPGMAYLVRRLLENISNESFLRKSFVENKSIDELIQAPSADTMEQDKEKDKEAFMNEPFTDFSKEENRQKMHKALEKARMNFNRAYPLYIGNKKLWKDDLIISANPARPYEIIGKVSSSTIEEAGKALEEARGAWDGWKRTGIKERVSYLIRAADEMRKMRFELSALEVFEVGKSWTEADADIAEAIDFLEYYGREMMRLGKPIRPGQYPGEYNEYTYEAKGVGVVISPWNFPIAIPAGMISAGIVTGNCIVFKPSGLSPVSGWQIMEAFIRAGLPPGVLQFLPGPGNQVGEYLVSHQDTDFIIFTGSKDVGLKIAGLAGEVHSGQRNVKKVVAEMGGKNAIIVDETADMDEAVKGVLDSALGFQGQKCSACSRVIVVGDMYSNFCERLADAMESIRIGPPENPANFMGPIVDKAEKDRIDRYIELGRRDEKTLLIRPVEHEGYFCGPAIFTDVGPDSVIARDEIFGPVLSIINVSDIDEAITAANNTVYALTGGLYSRSPSNIDKAKNDLRAGNLYINRKITGALVGRQPFGGFGMSGIGSKAGGPDYLLQFMNPRSISENTMRKGFTPEQH
jgi:RHH-type proline utilization regulon transcriptional repressor/proline dehydrogenase/delta 1-pyrroline-5-carboxylate dehydrogenase